MGVLDDVFSAIDEREEEGEQKGEQKPDPKPEPTGKRIHQFSDAFEREYGRKT